jgi:hypothetical protein
MPAMSFVKAMQHFFTQEPNGKKLEIAEFKGLTPDDRKELRDELIREGYEVDELKTA